jgi:hypothetical protein
VFFRSESKQDSFWVSDGAWISVLTATVSHKIWPPGTKSDSGEQIADEHVPVSKSMHRSRCVDGRLREPNRRETLTFNKRTCKEAGLACIGEWSGSSVLQLRPN